ncbi:MAG: hypothetical protein O2955_07685 [Planctomycetota bacterium]|nr:hypothetical protein [Planctomycetota bacterium]MDA1212381.1 hypothetical protein [Planctomycetota bacterium]
MFRFVAIFAICSTLVTPAVLADDSLVNEKVLEFSRKNIGREVGNGECSGLAEEALDAAGAKSYRAFDESPQEGDLVWGELTYVLEIKESKRVAEKMADPAVRSGDIVQLRDVLFEGQIKSRPYKMFTPQHTAVINFISKDGTKWNVIQQSVNGRKKVAKGIYNLNDLKKGSIRVYRPVPLRQESEETNREPSDANREAKS